MLFYYLLLITCYLDICKIYFKIFCDSKLIVKFIYKGKKKDQNLLFLLASILIYNKLIDTKFVNNVFTHSLLPFKIVNELSQVFKIQALFIQFFFFFEHKLSSRSSPKKIICSSLAHFLVEQAWDCSRATWLTYYFLIYIMKPWLKCFYLFIILWIFNMNRPFIINKLQMIVYVIWTYWQTYTIQFKVYKNIFLD